MVTDIKRFVKHSGNISDHTLNLLSKFGAIHFQEYVHVTKGISYQSLSDDLVYNQSKAGDLTYFIAPGTKNSKPPSMSTV